MKPVPLSPVWSSSRSWYVFSTYRCRYTSTTLLWHDVINVFYMIGRSFKSHAIWVFKCLTRIYTRPKVMQLEGENFTFHLLLISAAANDFLHFQEDLWIAQRCVCVCVCTQYEQLFNLLEITAGRRSYTATDYCNASWSLEAIQRKIHTVCVAEQRTMALFDIFWGVGPLKKRSIRCRHCSRRNLQRSEHIENMLCSHFRCL